MKLLKKIKEIFTKQKIEDTSNTVPEEYQIIMNGIDKCALYFKERERKFVLVKDQNFPFILTNMGLEFIEMNKNNFEHYQEFYNFETMFDIIQNLEQQERENKKTEDDYLVDYLKHSDSKYAEIIEKMKLLKIDQEQYNECINLIKTATKGSIEYLLCNYVNSNPDLETERTYQQIMENLIREREFKKSFPYYEEITKGEEGISHCGYPDYMWQSGAERDIYHIE